MMGAQSDFTVVGYSSEGAMTSFIDGTATIVDGAVFTEGTTDAILKRLISTNFAANISV